jgi:Transposase DDE domain
LNAPETLERFRVHPTDFSRRRKLPFSLVVLLILRGHKVSLQRALNHVFQTLGRLYEVATASALSQARRKINPDLFIYLTTQVWQEFYAVYGPDARVERWRGRRVLGVDGTYLNLPDTPELRTTYSVQTNQHDRGARVQALASVLYALRNDIGLSAARRPKQAEKNFLFDDHWASTQANDVVVLDRASADYTVMAWIAGHGRAFVMRFPRQSFAAVNTFWVSAAVDQEVDLQPSAEARKFVATHRLPTPLRVRLIKVVLDSGEEEVLGTNLLDTAAFPTAEFAQVYRWRWQEETYCNRLKNIFEVERFSAPSLTAVAQDCHGLVFLATLEGILTKSAQAEMTAHAAQHECQNTPRVNRAISYTALLDHTVELLAATDVVLEQVWDKLHHLFQTNPSRHRMGRQFPRHHPSTSQKHWFVRYGKRLIA